MAFVDLEKAFDRVPREVLCWALREVEVEEWLIKVIIGGLLSGILHVNRVFN